MTPSEELRAANTENWMAATRHAFTDALADGSLSEDKMAGYLQQDYHFVDAFVRLLASAIAAAPALADRIPGAQFLAIVTGEENTYFQRSFAEFGVMEHAPRAPETQGFLNVMDDARRSGEYEQMLAVLTVAEWIYLDWAAPHEDKAAGLPFYLGEWITLHCGADFEDAVGSFRNQLDKVWPDLSPDARQKVRGIFAMTASLERAFFDAAWVGFPVAR